MLLWLLGNPHVQAHLSSSQGSSSLRWPDCSLVKGLDRVQKPEVSQASWWLLGQILPPEDRGWGEGQLVDKGPTEWKPWPTAQHWPPSMHYGPASQPQGQCPSLVKPLGHRFSSNPSPRARLHAVPVARGALTTEFRSPSCPSTLHWPFL